MPILLWGSIPCTGGTPWARYNLRRYPDTFPARLRKLRWQWRRMCYNFYRIAEFFRKRNGHWAIEWPSKCDYWKSPQVLDFLRQEKGEIFQATARGCAFGLRAIAGEDRGRLMSKAWHIKSTMPKLPEYLERSCSYSSKYIHGKAAGQNTAHSGRYTTEFVSSVHKMFSNHVSNGSEKHQ